MQKQSDRRLAAVLVAAALVTLTAASVAPAQIFHSLVSFNGTNGEYPFAPLVQGADGNLYGTTAFGGANNWGTVFKMSPGGTLITLYSFCTRGTNCLDGRYPLTALMLGTDGDLYGTTYNGGTRENYGTIFKITSAGTLTTLHSFASTDGAHPDAALIQATDGNFYGTTEQGGAGDECPDGCGTAFKITPRGKLTVLHSFHYADGSYPEAALVQGTDGNFYGTTLQGGADGYGTIFKLSSAGKVTTLHDFDLSDGAFPSAPLVEVADGSLSGTTMEGGAFQDACINGCGTIFRLSLAGSLKTLHSFNSTDGAAPSSGLIQATDGNFVGTTWRGGGNEACNYGCGTVFKFSPENVLTTLHSFGFGDGAGPTGGLVQATNGTFYGTTSGGVDSSCNLGCGTVFSLSAGIGPFR